MRPHLPPSQAARSRKRPKAAEAEDAELFGRLRVWRKAQAEAQSVPPYVVFSDATLVAIADAAPSSRAGLAQISGVGPTKLTRYAEPVLAVLGGADPAEVAPVTSPHPVGRGVRPRAARSGSARRARAPASAAASRDQPRGHQQRNPEPVEERGDVGRGMLSRLIPPALPPVSRTWTHRTAAAGANGRLRSTAPTSRELTMAPSAATPTTAPS